jgi:DinB superfamily
VNAIGMLAQQLETVNLRIHHSAGDLTPTELVAQPLPGVNPIAFLLWHMARSQDWAVNTAILDRPEVIMRVPWTDSALAVPGIGTGFELDEAARIAAPFNLHDLLDYIDAVHRDTLAWLHTVDEDLLDDIPDVAAHDARHAAYQTPGFRAEMGSGPEHDDAMGRGGGLPVWIFLTSVSITHLHRHLGELDLVKDFLRRSVSS